MSQELPRVVIDVLGLEYVVDPCLEVNVVMQIRFDGMPIDDEHSMIVRYTYDHFTEVSSLSDNAEHIQPYYRHLLRAIGRAEIYARGFQHYHHSDEDANEKIDFKQLDPNYNDDDDAFEDELADVAAADDEIGDEEEDDEREDDDVPASFARASREAESDDDADMDNFLRESLREQDEERERAFDELQDGVVHLRTVE